MKRNDETQPDDTKADAPLAAARHADRLRARSRPDRPRARGWTRATIEIDRIALTRASGVLLRRLARATLERRPDVPPTPSEWARAVSRARAAIDGRTVKRWISAGIIDVRRRRGDG
jgi:hypothetical protein